MGSQSGRPARRWRGRERITASAGTLSGEYARPNCSCRLNAPFFSLSPPSSFSWLPVSAATGRCPRPSPRRQPSPPVSPPSRRSLRQAHPRLQARQPRLAQLPPALQEQARHRRQAQARGQRLSPHRRRAPRRSPLPFHPAPRLLALLHVRAQPPLQALPHRAVLQVRGPIR
jgi:hypothetical protein